MIDAQGSSTTQPRVLLDTPGGTVFPGGGLSTGRKVYGLALLVEALTGGLDRVWPCWRSRGLGHHCFFSPHCGSLPANMIWIFR
ncbi:Ldh family oxidoreductase [Pusillimonas sp. ANT_WB101]|nr:Ldh family oxidoreductase [Pusillimonas sp. ANT_WB101]